MALDELTSMPGLPPVRNGLGKKNYSSSEKSQRILFWVRENWHFEKKSGKIEI